MPMTSDPAQTAPSLPREFDAFRVSDARFGRAYDRTGGRGRALIKSCIAALYQVARPVDRGRVSATARYHSGLVRTEEMAPRPWYAVALGPEAASPSQLVAALMPAVAARIPLILAFRPKARTAWPLPLLTALELSGVEQAFAPAWKNFKQCLNVLCGRHGRGTLVSLGGKAFRERVRAVVPEGCRLHGLVPPESAGLFAGPGIAWDREALAFAHAGLRLEEFGGGPDDAGRREAGSSGWAVFAPAAQAPESARLVVEPGREPLWDWPDLPPELFFARRLVYS